LSWPAWISSSASFRLRSRISSRLGQGPTGVPRTTRTAQSPFRPASSASADLAVHRMTSGRVLSSVAGMPVLLLTTTGRRSGKARTTTAHVLSARDRPRGDRIERRCGPSARLVAQQQTPRAVVQLGTDKLVVTARPASAQQRELLWSVITATYAGYARYQERTTRQIPVVLLTPEARRSPAVPERAADIGAQP
jgi:deazaflavin-dependent oxidoreductase (nitroreductase family)